MAKGTRICKICGIEYEYCHTARPKETFRWQDVACCPEHAEQYLKKILESRTPKQTLEETQEVSVSEEPKVPKKKKSKKVNNYVDFNELI